MKCCIQLYDICSYVLIILLFMLVNKKEIWHELETYCRQNRSMFLLDLAVPLWFKYSAFSGFTADWWSVGIILFELIVGIPPFNADHPQVVHCSIILFHLLVMILYQNDLDGVFLFLGVCWIVKILDVWLTFSLHAFGSYHLIHTAFHLNLVIFMIMR